MGVCLFVFVFAIAFIAVAVKVKFQQLVAVGAVDMPFVEHAFVYANGVAAVGANHFVKLFVVALVVLIVCILADYIFAFTVLGITGLFKNKGTKGILIGTFLAVFLRFVCHYISGVTIWKSTDMNPYVYSLLYNGSYMLPECVFTMIGTFALSKVPAFKKILERK